MQQLLNPALGMYVWCITRCMCMKLSDETMIDEEGKETAKFDFVHASTAITAFLTKVKDREHMSMYMSMYHVHDAMQADVG
jgi:hypothetical protein